MLGTAAIKTVGAASTSDMIRSGNAPNYFRQVNNGGVVIDVNKHISRNHKLPGTHTTNFSHGESTKSSHKLGKSQSTINIAGRNAAKANDYMTI